MTPSRYSLVLVGFGLQRLAELAYSRGNERRIRRLEPHAPQAAAPGFRWMVLANAGLFTLPALEVALRRPRRVPLAVRITGWSGAIGALALRLGAILALRDQWNVRALVPQGVRVVDGGPYRYIRHPNYAVALEFAALPLIGGAYVSAIGLSLANGLVLRDRIRSEEALLHAVPAYRERMEGKPRFLPRLGDLIAR